MRYSKSWRGFTLVELLVVVAIIAVLTAILFPVFANARLAAQKSACQSNLKQIHGAWTLYFGDYDDRLPTQVWGDDNACQDPANANKRLLIAARLEPYVNNRGVHKCLSDALPWSTCDTLQGRADSWVGSYGFNNFLNSRQIGEINIPSQTFLSYDAGFYLRPWNYKRNFNWTTDSRTALSGFEARHSNQVNTVFVDGHVRTLRCSQMFPCEREEWWGQRGVRANCWGDYGTYTNGGAALRDGTCPPG